MFSKEPQAAKRNVSKPINDMLISELPENLINTNKHKQLLEQIEASFIIGKQSFTQRMLPLILKVAKYCQKLPEPALFYSHLGGLFDFALNRTEVAMQLLKPHLLLEKDDKPTDEQALWQYALFSASMLQGLGKLYTSYSVDVYDQSGYQIKTWQPLLESIPTVGRHYQYSLLRGDDIELQNSITQIIARRIMPKPGFERLISNKEVFATWLALLREDKDGMHGPFAAILDRANAIAIQRYIKTFLALYGNRDLDGKLASNFVDPKGGHRIDREKIIGAEFIAWLTDNLDNGKIIINKEPLIVEVREASVVLHPSVLDIFMQEHKKLKNRVAMQKAFLAWNMHLLTDSALESLSQKGEKGLNAISISTAILPNKVFVHNTKSDKISKVSSLELVNNLAKYDRLQSAVLESNSLQLNTKGEWVAGENNAARIENTANKV